MGLRRLLLQILIIFLLVLIFTPPVNATTADVIVTLDHDSIIYDYKPNSTRELYINGTISCEMEGLGQEIQYIKVTIELSDNEGWIREQLLSNVEKSLSSEKRLLKRKWTKKEIDGIVDKALAKTIS